MQLVVLAAGHGRRFGGLKQLAPVGPDGEAIMDYTAEAADACGVEGVVLVVREDIHREIAEHVRKHWPSSLAVEYVDQPPIPGTAQAVYAAHAAVDGPFGVANADDLYGADAIGVLVGAFGPADAEGVTDDHVLVGYELARTVLSSEQVTRGLVEVGDDGRLAKIVEHTVVRRDDGQFEARPLPSNEPHEVRTLAQMAPKMLTGAERVSMNLWGFHHRLFTHLAEALDAFHPETAPARVLLPDVVGHLVDRGSDRFHVVATTGRCLGITHQQDLDIVKDEPARAAPRKHAVEIVEDPLTGGGAELRRIQPFAATKAYRCPGCNQEIAVGTGHVVIVPFSDAGQRRHWHAACWQRRATRRPGR